MQFEEEHTQNLKDWIIKRLENISDADADVLADYVLALVKSDEPDAQVKANCSENLEDFLREHTQPFVDDLFASLNTKSYIAGYIAPSKLSATATTFQPPPTGPSAQHSFQAQGDQSRKRTREGSEVSNQYGRGYDGERAMKQSRRGGRGGRGGTNGGYNGSGYAQYPTMPQNMPSMPTPPPGFPPLDPNNPMAAIMAMQAMGFPSLPGFPGLPGSPAPNGAPPLIPSIRQRCRDYDTKGYCAAGSNCPYEHGVDHIVLPGEEYDPKNASLSSDPPRETFHHDRGRGRGRGRGKGGRGDFQHSGRGQRAAFSAPGPNSDRNITTIVVEQVPEDKFNEDAIKEFFGDFGNIEEVTMQAYKRLAVVKYSDYNSAKRAYESPKVIFDNRFVKVYWYKPEAFNEENPGFANGGRAALPHARQDAAPPPAEDAEMIDPEELARKTAEAQQAYEGKARKLKEAEAQKEELAQKIKAAAEERKKLMEKLAAKTAGKNGTATPGATATNGHAANADAKTTQEEALRAKLAELEAEAEAIGLPAEDPAQAFPSYRGRGGYTPYPRGGGYRGRGRGAPAWRGGWQGGAAPAGGAVARLDNRPRNVEIKAVEDGVDFADDKVGEALRLCLFGNADFTAITPTSKSTAIGTGTMAATVASSVDDGSAKRPFTIISFSARYVADIFIDNIKRGGSTIAGIGKVELGWVANDVAKAAAEAAGTLPVAEVEQNKDVGMVDAAVEQDQPMMSEGNLDYDVADDDEDRWGR